MKKILLFFVVLFSFQVFSQTGTQDPSEQFDFSRYTSSIDLPELPALRVSKKPIKITDEFIVFSVDDYPQKDVIGETYCIELTNGLSRELAQNFVSRAESKLRGEKLFIAVDESNLYSVRYGAYVSYTDAADILFRTRQLGFENSMIVKNTLPKAE